LTVVHDIPAQKQLSALKSMYPVRFQEINEENDGTQRPGQRVGPENYIDNGNYFYRYTDIGNTDDTPAAHHNQHGDDGFSCAAQDTGHAVGEGQQKIEECYGAGLSGTKRNHLRIIIKSGYQYRSKPRRPTSSAVMTEHRMPKRAPFLARSYLPAPRFWLMKVVMDIAKQVIGRKPKPSILE